MSRAVSAGFEAAPSRAALFAESDVLTLQLRLAPTTAGVVSANDLALMAPSAVLINTSRAQLIQPGALVAALKAGRPGFAAVDTFEQEPILGAHDPLLALPNALCVRLTLALSSATITRSISLPPLPTSTTSRLGHQQGS